MVIPLGPLTVTPMTFREQNTRFNRLGRQTQSCLSACSGALPWGRVTLHQCGECSVNTLPVSLVAVTRAAQEGLSSSDIQM